MKISQAAEKPRNGKSSNNRPGTTRLFPVPLPDAAWERRPGRSTSTSAGSEVKFLSGTPKIFPFRGISERMRVCHISSGSHISDKSDASCINSNNYICVINSCGFASEPEWSLQNLYRIFIIKRTRIQETAETEVEIFCSYTVIAVSMSHTLAVNEPLSLSRLILDFYT